MTTYLIDALIVEGFGINVEYWTFANRTLVMTGVFSVLVLIAKLIDGLADIPLAALTDGLKSKWGKRRPAILIGYIPMVLSLLLFCFPPTLEAHSALNTAYFGVLLTVFFTSYTLTFVTYYGTYSEVTANADDRVRLSHWKAFFDTILYSVGYAVIPLFIGLHINIRFVALALMPLLLTMLIVFFILKEKSTLTADVEKEQAELAKLTTDAVPLDENVSFVDSVKLTVKNKGFMIWLGVMAAFFFGLQMFLAGQNVLASGAMGLNGWQMAIMNTSAFAPVPLMLIIYRRVMKKKGFRFAFQTALAAFAMAMIVFSIAYVEWIPSTMARLILGAIGGTIGSYGIGAFFSAPYVIPSQMAAEEMERTGKSHPSMYFAMQGLFNAIVAAFSTSVIWLNIRGIIVNGEEFFGAHLMPYIVAFACLVSIVLAFFLPKSFSDLGRGGVNRLSEKDVK
ncbi:MAG: MFS transporter [Comamonadaceae bacterium]|nr:MFS transporter [Comamonadaceae bacterium]